MPPDAAKRLFDALSAARQIQEFAAGLDRESFSKNKMVRSAVERQFEIIGEALAKAAELVPELERQLPELRRVVGLRNRLIHGYDNVDDAIVWDIVETKLGPLARELRRLLAEAGFPDK